MSVRRFIVPLTVNSSGALTTYTPFLSGYVQEIHYIKTDFADGVDFTVTAEATGETIWAQLDVNAAAVVAPRQPTHTTAGVASLYAGSGTAVNDRIAVSRDRIKIVIAAGGVSKSGALHIVVAD